MIQTRKKTGSQGGRAMASVVSAAFGGLGLGLPPARAVAAVSLRCGAWPGRGAARARLGCPDKAISG